jgi:hypothetical protein
MGNPIIAVVFVIIWASLAGAQTAAPTVVPTPQGRTLTDADWRQDLAVMLTSMKSLHKDLFHAVSQQQLETAVQQLSADIPSLNDDQIKVRFVQIGAMVRDGHSGVDVTFRPGLTHVPLWIVRYEDGIFVSSAARAYSGTVGARVTAIGGVPWKEALARIDTIISCDPGNDGQRLGWHLSIDLNDPLLLHGLGLSDSSSSATYTLEKEGKVFQVTLSPTLNASDLVSLPGPANWVDAQTTHGIQPLSRPWSEPIAFTEVPEANALYLQFNEVSPPKGESMDQFAARFTQFSETHDATRLVIDLRHNSGGDNTLLRPLLISLIRSRFNHRGGMFALIGPVTFSAAQTFVDRLELYTDTIFVGRPTSANVNFYGDPAGRELPNSHLDLEMAHVYWQDEDPRDKRTATFPEIAISSGSFTDYVEGKDAALDYCLHAPVPDRFEDLLTAASAEGEEAALARYRSYVEDPAHVYSGELEKRVNAQGYKLLAAQQNKQAVILFQVNTVMHSESANAFDSLGDGETANNERDAAIKAYRRSLQLNPQNTHAKQAIKDLQAAQSARP